MNGQGVRTPAIRPWPGCWNDLLGAVGQDISNPDMSLQISVGDVLTACGLDAALWTLRLVDDRCAILRAILPAVKRATRHADRAWADVVEGLLDLGRAGDEIAFRWESATSAESAWRAKEAAWEAFGGPDAASLLAVAAVKAALATASIGEDGDGAWWASEAANLAAEALVEAAVTADGDADATRLAEREAQTADLMAVFPPMVIVEQPR